MDLSAIFLFNFVGWVNDMIETKKIISVLKDKYQLDISTFSTSFLEKVLLQRMTFYKYIRIDEYLTELLYNQEEVRLFVDALQIPYTHFFRDALSYEVLLSVIIPEFINQNPEKKQIRVWSIGCSTGQEPYSLAMIFEEAMLRYHTNINYRIFASDINEEVLQRARIGKYSASEVGNIRCSYLQRYFTLNEGVYEISSSLKEHIRFNFHNLLDHSKISFDNNVFASFDIIVCMNVLYYYQEEVQDKMIRKILLALNNKGYLITSETEKYLVKTDSSIERVQYQAPIFHKQKRGDTYEI